MPPTTQAQPTTTPQSGGLDPIAQTLTQAIAMQEGGGKLLPYTAASGDEPNAPQGTAGGRYQFIPDTWKNYAGQVLGNPNAPMTPDNQNQVAYSMIDGWLKSGKTPAQAASMWNAGEGAPDAWKPGTVQAHGDTPQYVQNVQKYAQQLASKQLPQAPTGNLASAQSGLPSMPQAATSGQSSGAMPGLPNMPSAAGTDGGLAPTPQAQPKSDLLGTATNILTSLFPGSKTLGEYLGTKLAQVEAGPNAKYVDTSAATTPTGGQALAATGELGLEGAASAIPGGGGVLGRIGTQAALGAGIGGLNAAATGGNVVGGAALGGVAGGAVGGAMEGLGALANFIPKGIIKARFPQLSDDAADYLINNKPIGTVSSIIQNAADTQSQVGEQISNTLQSPQYADRLINSQEVLGRTVAGDPNIPTSGLANSGATQQTLRKTAMSLVGKTSGALVDKLFPADGSVGALTLDEAHDLSSDIGNASAKNFANIATSPQNKKVGMQLYFGLTSALKENAPELAPMFDEYSMNTAIRIALSKAAKKSGQIGLTDYLTLLSGFAGGSAFGAGVPAAAGALAAKKAIQSPTADILAAKGVAGLGGLLASPLGQAGGRVAGVLGGAYAQPLIKGLIR